MYAARVPTVKQWDIAKAYQQRLQQRRLMEPREFLEYWQLSYTELAKLLGISKSTVAHWFSESHSRTPSEAIKQRLSEIHALWMQFENEPEHLRSFYERQLRNKKKN